jgi:hypothetical protein
MNRPHSNQLNAHNSEKQDDKESTLLPMLLAGLILIVIGAGVVMTLV